MKIVISGKTGFIGSKLTEYFSAKGYVVDGIGRKDFSKGMNRLIKIIDGADIVINLAGAPIVKRWTQDYSRELWNSRIDTTKALAEAIINCANPPSKFLSASAVGIYSSEGNHSENSYIASEDFLGILCQRWEEEAMRARIKTQVKILRIGIVLGREGGALPKMALPFRFFVGGPLGSGRQKISWIHVGDLVRAVHHIIDNETVHTVYNFTAPNPVTNSEFSQQLSKTLNRPNLFPVPAITLKLIFGEGAVALLNGQHAIPENLMREDFSFEYPDLKSALKNLLL